METSPVTWHTLEEYYHIDGHTLEKQYKEVLSGFRQWEQLEHADEWLLFSENTGRCLAIDESSLSNGELYTFVTNREARTRERVTGCRRGRYKSGGCYCRPATD